MARIIGGLTTSHIPSIGNAVPREAQLVNDPYWKPFFAGYPPAREWVQKVKPDVAIVIYNDHGLNFFLNNMPTFAIGAAADYRNADEGWGIPTIPPFQGDPDLSWHIIESVVEDEFDVASCQEMLVDHGFTVPMSLFWPNNSYSGVKTIPVCINTVQHPLPTPMRCFKFGQAIGRAIESYPKDINVLVMGTGGLVSSARWRARRLHQQGIRPALHGKDRQRSGSAGPLLDPRAWCASRALRAPNSFFG